jgi:hypothetical protein
MRRPLRHRLVPVLATACLVGVLLGPGTARAATPTVTFHGGCGLLGVGASSRPDPASLSVSAGAPVAFVNQLGQSAELMINGVDRGSVPADHQVSMAFRPGRVSVSLVPACLLGGGGAGTATITVTAATGHGSPSGPGSPSNRGSPEARTSPGAGVQPSTAPGAAAPPDRGVVPSPAGSVSATGGGDISPDPVPTGDGVAAVGPVLPGPPGRPAPSGLLVLVAAICVVGVSIAAVRAIIAQRAIRATST